ncbi:MAG TPA: DMT family transporter [Opitutaceae bacterium]|nr:DMT family transporter [Opitutaceae bacterium]
MFPLGSAVLYAIGALAIKRSNQFGIGLWRISFLANWAMAFCMAPVWLLGGEIPPGLWWQPLVVGFFFFTAQTFMFLALTRGDVSVATPIMGTKVLMVAMFSLLVLPGPVPWNWWIAAFLSTAGVYFLSRGDAAARRGALNAALFAFGAATFFALNDVLVQKWAPAWGIGRFLPIMFAGVALMSFAFVPLFHAPLRQIPRQGRVWVAVGAIILGIQAVGILFAIGRFGDATAVNIVYSVRGMLSVIFVWLAGHWFLNEEQQLARPVLVQRFIGSVLMVSAVVLVVV